MNEKTKELVAIGASIAGHCQPCLSYHVNKAKDLGIDEAEIREAIKMGQMVEKGALSAMRTFADRVFDEPSGEAPHCCAGGGNEAGTNGCK